MSGYFINLISTCTSAILTNLNWVWNEFHHQSIFEVLKIGRVKADSSRLHQKGRSNEPVECVVCLSAIQEEDEIRELRCKHLFHKDCLDRCVEHKHTTCPLCRDNLTRPRKLFELGRELLVFNFCSSNSSVDDDFNRWWLR